MHPGITHCYPTRQNTPPPPLDSEGTWAWRGALGDWGYPMSLDAHVFRTAELAKMAIALEFANPNLFEVTAPASPSALPVWPIPKSPPLAPTLTRGSSSQTALAILCSGEGAGCASRMSSYAEAVVINLPVNLVQVLTSLYLSPSTHSRRSTLSFSPPRLLPRLI